MWSEFFLAFAVGAVFVLCPGFLFLRIAGIPRVRALCIAPLFSTLISSVLAIVYERVGIASNPLTVFMVPTAALLLGAGILLAVRSRAQKGNKADIPLKIAAAYVLVGVFIGLIVFVKNLDGPLSFPEQWDEVHHLNGTRAFAESQVFSFFGHSLYMPKERAAFFTSDDSFYPSAWHVTSALIMQACAVPATLAVNATNYLFSSVVAPLGMCVFMFNLFGDDRKPLLAGALAAVSFAAFPWLLLRWGPLFPNMAAYAEVPMSCSLFMRAYWGEDAPSSGWLCGIGLFACSLVGVVLMHPNGCFVVAVMMGSFLVQEAFQGNIQKKLGLATGKPWRMAAALIAVFGILWFAVFKMPAMQGVVEFNWESYQTPLQAAINYLTLAYVDGYYVGSGIASTAQLLLAALLIVGIAQVLKQRKRLRWLVQAYAFWFVAMVVGTSSEGLLKHLLAGFWYTDFCRIAAAAAICAIPLASLGIECAYRSFSSVYERFNEKHRIGQSAIVFAVLYLIVVFFPNYRIAGYFDVETGFGSLCASFESNYRFGPGMIDEEEAEFLEKVAEIVPDGAIVANNPFDGSVYAYGLYDIHILSRTASGYGSDYENPDLVIVRESIATYTYDEAVAEAVEDLGIEYVLLLKVEYEPPTQFSRNVGTGLQQWRGLYEIDEETPGFTLVLEDGEMRLYRVDGIE